MTLVISTPDKITHPSSNYHQMWLNFSDLMGTGVSLIITPHLRFLVQLNKLNNKILFFNKWKSFFIILVPVLKCKKHAKILNIIIFDRKITSMRPLCLNILLFSPPPLLGDIVVTQTVRVLGAWNKSQCSKVYEFFGGNIFLILKSFFALGL